MAQLQDRLPRPPASQEHVPPTTVFFFFFSAPPDPALPHAARTAEVVVAPSVSTMILRASSYIPPDVSERNLIACGLQKGMSLSSY